MGLCWLIALADALQPVLLDWRPKFVGALLGAIFYAVCAVAIGRGVRGMAWGVLLLPVVPSSLLGLWAAGVQVPVEPDAMMVAVWVLQLVAAGLAAAWLHRPPPT